MGAFLFTVDQEADDFVAEVVDILHGRYGLAPEAAAAAVTRKWGTQRIGGPKEVLYHDEPALWAERIFTEQGGTLRPLPAELPVRENDLVRVREFLFPSRYIGFGSPQIGDTATVSQVVAGPAGTVFTARSLDDDGNVVWEADFSHGELELLNPW